MANDGQRFLESFSRPISEGASQIYTSSLAFTPKNTILYGVYASQYAARQPIIISGQEHGWPALRSVLEGHQDSVYSVVFSPDGSRLASCSDDNTVRIWNAESGAPVGGPLEEHQDWVNSVIFLGDGTFANVSPTELMLSSQIPDGQWPEQALIASIILTLLSFS